MTEALMNEANALANAHADANNASQNANAKMPSRYRYWDQS